MVITSPSPTLTSPQSDEAMAEIKNRTTGRQVHFDPADRVGAANAVRTAH